MKSICSRRDFLKEAAILTLLSQLPLSAFAKEGALLKAKIISSGEELCRIGIGSYKTFDVANNPAAKDELAKVLKYFTDNGGSLIDSSPMYGAAEGVVGELSKKSELNKKLFMATKVWTSGRDAGMKQMEDSFDLMGRKGQKIDLMQIHNLVDWKTQLGTLRRWKEEGRVRYIGITHYTTSAFGELEKVLREEKGIDFLQVPYSLGETAAEKTLLPLAASKGVTVIANEPFGHGALFRQVQGKEVPAWAQELGVETWAQYFLKFILSSKDVQFAIPGTGKLKHIEDNMKAAKGELPNVAQRERMKKEFAGI